MLNSRIILEEIGPSLGRKSNSEEEEESNASGEEEVPDYVDKAGRKWHFLCHAKEEEKDLAQFVQQNGLVPGNENGKRRKFGCSRPECHFRAVFLKANSGIYTRGEHWHHEQADGKKKSVRKIAMKKTTRDERIICSISALSKLVCREKEEFFLAKGMEFRLVRRFETEEEFEGYRRENWLIQSRNHSDRISFSCRRGSGSHSKLSTNCRVSRIYVKRNRSLYQNNKQHNHPMGKEYEADYVDQRGQLWLFLQKMDTFDELDEFAKKQMLYINNNYGRLFFFKCKYADKGILKNCSSEYCKKKAVFIKATSSVYVRNEHSDHPKFKLKYSKKNHGKLYRELSDFFEENNAEKEGQNAMLNLNNEVANPKEEEADSNEGKEEGGVEVRIVKHLQRDYKCLGRMKREGEEGQRTRTDSDSRIDHTIQLEEEDDLEEGTSQGTRKRRSTFFRYTQRELQRPIKKEEPVEEAEEAGEEALQLQVPAPQMPPIAIRMPQWLYQAEPDEVARPAKMLLRERKKRINYGK